MRGGLENNKQVAMFEYDFDKDGGAVGNIELRGPSLPVGAIVYGPGKVKVDTAVTSAGLATVAVTLESAGDVLAATAKASLGAGDLLDTVPDGTAANAVEIATAAKKPYATIAVDDLDTGKFMVAVEYIVPDPK